MIPFAPRMKPSETNLSDKASNNKGFIYHALIAWTFREVSIGHMNGNFSIKLNCGAAKTL